MTSLGSQHSGSLCAPEPHPWPAEPLTTLHTEALFVFLESHHCQALSRANVTFQPQDPSFQAAASLTSGHCRCLELGSRKGGANTLLSSHF